MSTIPELLVTEGPLKGRRFAVPASGLRLGRSSSCEISIPDPSLSRNHCLFETRDGNLWVTDLASANGTAVNEEILGPDSRCLRPGDKVVVGDSALRAVSLGESSAPAAEPTLPKIDLGLGAGEQPAADKSPGEKPAFARLALWGVAAVCVIAAAVLFCMPDAATSYEQAPETHENGPDELLSFSFEKVDANPKSIFRYALSYDGKKLDVRIDDVKGEGNEKDRHVAKSMDVDEDSRKGLKDILRGPELYRLGREYAGVEIAPNSHQEYTLRIVRSTDVFEVSVENQVPPEALVAVMDQLESFAKTKFGIWAIQYPVEKLIEMSAESRREADAKWGEKDVRHGNIAMALSKYAEAIVFLDTVEPKPADYAALVKRRREVEAELERRFADQRFRADRAIKMEDWETARRELNVLREMVWDKKDKRYREAQAQLLEIEKRK